MARINHPVSAEVARRLKSQAALEGKTISEKLEEVLRSALGLPEKPAEFAPVA
jgi:hypothetical protein